MPRPRKHRVVCALPRQNLFGPMNPSQDAQILTMSVEEYETIRLMDGEGLSQEECASRMDVARTTVQRIYAQARQKMASSLVEGLILKVEGGDYRLCRGLEEEMPAKNCRRCCRKRKQTNETCSLRTDGAENT